MFIEHDSSFNLFIVRQAALKPDYVGKYKIEISASYVDNKGKLATLKTFFFLTVRDQQTEEKPVVQVEEAAELVEGYVWIEGAQIATVSEKQLEDSVERPIPYIKSFSRVGLMQVAWTD